MWRFRRSWSTKTVHVSLLVVNLEAIMENAHSHEWGGEFRVSGQAIRKKYPDYTSKHDQMAYDDMVKEYAAANCVRVLREAPAPSDDQANQVGAFGGKLTALQRAFDDYEESAFSVDKDSGRSKKRKKKKKKKKEKKNDNESRSGCSKHHSNSQGCSKLTDDRKVKKIKHCKEDRPYAGKRDENKCFHNKKYKGWRPSKICKELGVKFKRRHEYSSEMGGFASSTSEESSSGSDNNSGATSNK